MTATSRLAALTGLKSDFATKCLQENDGSFSAALASFAQSFPILMPGHFDDPALTVKNEAEINALLEDIYGAVQCVVDLAKTTEEAAWAALKKTTEWNAAVAIEAVTGKPAPASAKTPGKFQRDGTIAAAPATTATSGAATPAKNAAAPTSAATTPQKSPQPAGAQALLPTPGAASTPAKSPAADAPSPAKTAVTPGESKTSFAFGKTPVAAASATTAAPAAPAPAPEAKKAAVSAFGKTVAPAQPKAAAAAPAATPSAPAAPTDAKKSAFTFGKAVTPAPASAEPKAAVAAPFGGKAPVAAPFGAKAAPGVVFGTKAVAGAPAPSGSSAEAKKPAGFGVSKPVAQDTKAALDPSTMKPLPADRYAGCYWDMPDFWKLEVEGTCALLTKNYGFLQKTSKEALRERLLKWVEVSKLYSAPVNYVEIPDPDDEPARTIIKDCDRTFFTPVFRTKFKEFLFAMSLEFRMYGQAMSYLAGLCLLVLTEHETAMVLRKVGREYIVGHWATEAVGFATNAWLIAEVMRKFAPEVSKHFDALNFWPDTYMQKVISALCIHCISFEQVFTFIDHFMAQGFPWLVKFELALVEHFKMDILACKAEDVSTLFEIMRLDSRAAEPDDVAQIMNRALRMDLGDTVHELDVMRMTVYNEKVGPRLAKVPKEEAFEPCALCEENKPKLWCDTCELAICKACNEADAKGHNKATCKVEPY